MRKNLFVCVLYLLLIMNYMFNVLNPNNADFADFQYVSDSLVLDMVIADQNHVNTEKWGLGHYADSAGWLIGDPIALRKNLEELYTTNDMYTNGYAKTGDGIILHYTATYTGGCKIGNFIQFEDGTKAEIIKVEMDSGENSGWTVSLQLEAKGLSEEVNGSLLNIKFLDEWGNEYPNGFMNMYDSQYGLQGRIVRRLAFIGHNDLLFSGLHWACAALTAFILLLIVWQIYVKYDGLMAGIFYIVFLLSPWIVNFARNTYWLEFLWFVPMLVGLIFSNYKKKKIVRYGCYVSAFFAILIKALCGYEYITTIMLGLIMFLLVDLFVDSFDRLKRKEIVKDIIHIFLLGICALTGFIVAVLIHANLRGEGNILDGIESIYVEDLLRSTLSEWRPEYGEGYIYSMNASLWSVLLSYFHRPEEIISGIGGEFFPLLTVSPIIILLYNDVKNRMDKRDCFLYIFTFITSISWFVLGKSHSAMHGFLNFVLWNFGYVQMCSYIVVKQFVVWVRKNGQFS